MSITARTGEQLLQQGIFQPRDLVKVVPSFNYADSYVGSPIYTLRGVGFSDISLGGRPTVSIYVDEAPIPFAIETRGTNLDLERVEVLKGPQGTLFGQNATGGAINFVDAKPTSTIKAGLDASYGNFNAVDISGFFSAPVTDTLGVRLAVQHTQNDDWQKSYTTNATNGSGDFTSGRLIAAWTPNSKFKVQLNVNGWIDKSEVQASQLIAISPAVPPFAPFVPGLLTYPLAPQNARAADFNPGENYHRSNSFFQTNARFDYSLTDTLLLTSITAYSNYHEHQLQDIDGTTLSNLAQQTLGYISSISQELRLSGRIADKGHFVFGGNYAADTVNETNYDAIPQSTTALVFTPLGLPAFTNFRDISDQQAKTYALFGNVDYSVTPTVRLYGGLRYTQANLGFTGCTSDSGDGVAASVFGPFQNFVRGQFGLPPNPPIPPGGCITANAQFQPVLTVSSLDQNNVSWRGGADWTPRPGTLLYANVSRGYKAGGYPDLAASSVKQLDPAVQESVIAYEAGFKTALVDHTLQLNGAGFYYDYSDKQILGKVVDPVFGPLLKLVNVPKSRIIGAELQADWYPVRGLTISVGGSYIHSEILDNFTNFNPNGVLTDFNGEAFPNTPRWQLVSNANYTFRLTENLKGFVGGAVTYQSSTNSQLGELPLLSVPGYALVDLRAGVESADGAWRVSVWGRNIGNVYYWTSANADLDTTTRFAGMPATYGFSLSYRYQ